MLIKVKKEFLDVPRGTKLNFTRKNNVLNFGSLELERTTNFQLPTTAKNNRILASAFDPHTYGDIQRGKLEATLQYDSANFDGYLYVDKCDKSKYNCVFVFGSLAKLKQISDYGEIGNYYANSINFCTLNSVNDANTYLTYSFSIWKYVNNTNYTKLFPTFNLKKILENVVNVEYDNNDIANYPICLIGYSAKVGGTETNQLYNYYQSGGNKILQLGQGLANVAKVVNSYSYALGAVRTQEQFFYLENDVKITFPSTLSDDLFLIDNSKTQATFNWNGDFYGGYGFDTTIKFNSYDDTHRTIVGTPLKNRTITLKATNDNNERIYYSFGNINNFSSKYENGITTHGFVGGSALVNFTIPTMTSELNNATLGSNTRVYMRDNCPKITFIDIINAFRYFLNAFIVFENNTLKFKNFNCSTWNIIQLKNIISVGEIERKVGELAQSNDIVFDSEEYIQESWRLRQNYTINNKLLSDKKELYKLKGSEGLPYEYGLVNVIDVDDTDGQGKTNAKKNTFGVLGVGTNIRRIDQKYFGYNAEIQQILNESTSLKVTCFMNSFEFFSIKENNLIYYDGIKWLWKSATWNDGKATFELQKYA